MWVVQYLNLQQPLRVRWIFLCFHIFDRPGLNFNAINLKILQMVGLIEGYNLCNLTSFFDWQIFFRIFIKIHNIEIHNRLLWVRWYHRNSTFPPYWNAGMPSFAQYELIKPRERPAIWWISTFLWYNVTQRGCWEFQYCGNTHFLAISILSG